MSLSAPPLQTVQGTSVTLTNSWGMSASKGALLSKFHTDCVHYYTGVLIAFVSLKRSPRSVRALLIALERVSSFHYMSAFLYCVVSYPGLCDDERPCL